MANQEHLSKLNEGVEAWNQWRDEYPDVQPDLSLAELPKANLVGANLSGANLGGAYLHSANLNTASLNGANLDTASLNGADLSEANLSGTNLIYANLIAANLREADLSQAHIRYTVFAWVDLRRVKGLDTVVHNGPSSIDVHTVELPQGNVLRNFLRGAGFSDTFIDYFPSLLKTPIEYQSCFISHSSKDGHFAEFDFVHFWRKGHQEATVVR